MTASLNDGERQWLLHRRHVWLAGWIFSPFVGFPLAVFIGVYGGRLAPISTVVAVASMISGVVFGWKLQFARCPRCSKLFWSVPGRWHFIWPTRSCRHCGFPGAHE